MKILTAEQQKNLDIYTIENEPIAPIDLMERAAGAFTERFVQLWGSNSPVVVFAGAGNNGGDALAIARLLSAKGYEVEVFFFNTSGNATAECASNCARLASTTVRLHEITTEFKPPVLTAEHIVIDGLFGIGLNRVLSGGYAAVVRYINASAATVVAIDIPSGLMAEDNGNNVMSNVIKADHTITFNAPKPVFFLAENAPYIGTWEVVDIQEPANAPCLEQAPSYSIIEREEVCRLLKQRPQFAHKGTMGHAALVAGSLGMAGAAILSAKACLRSGVGKITIYTQECNRTILQASVPEAVLNITPDEPCFVRPFKVDPYDAIGMGPGIGTDEATAQAISMQFEATNAPMVIDADAINLLAQMPSVAHAIPSNSILTPHRRELERLLGPTHNTYELYTKAQAFAAEHQLYIIAKGAYTAIIAPNGSIRFNPTGNPGMATAGSGDVLTGILTALMARGYTSEETALLGVYLHGLAGDLAAQELGMESVIASDIIDFLPKAFKNLQSQA